MTKKLLVAGLLCAALALAQGRKGNRGGDDSGGDMGVGLPAAANRLDDISTALNLNKDQKKAARAFLDEGAKAAAPIREQMSKSRVAVGEAITANKSQEELKQIAKTSSDLAAQIAQLELKTFAKIYAGLDDTQKKDLRGVGRALALTIDMYRNKNWTEE